MIPDLLAVISINTRLGCQTVTPRHHDDSFHARDVIHEGEGDKQKPFSRPGFLGEVHGGLAEALGTKRTRRFPPQEFLAKHVTRMCF